MTILGLYLAMGAASWVHRLLAISSWNAAYSLSLNWIRLSLRNDQPLIASNQRWCYSLRNLCPSNSTSTSGAALEPSPTASFLALLAGSFLGAISCEDTFAKLVCMKYQSPQQKPNKLEWCTFPSTKCKCQRALRQQSHIGACAILWCISMYMHIYFFERHFMIYIHVYIFWRAFYEVYPCIYIFFF